MMLMKIVELDLHRLDLSYVRLRAKRPPAEKRLLISLGEYGQQNPVIVVAGAASGRYEVIDGHKRVRALGKLRRDVVKAVIWEMDAAEALSAAYQLGKQGSWSVFEEGWLIAELHRVRGWSLGRIGVRLMRSKGWVSKRLSLIERMPGWLADEVSSGRIGAHGASHHILPFTRVNEGDAKRVVEKLRSSGTTDRELAALYGHYKAGSREERRKLVEDPKLYLRVLAAAAQGRLDPRLSVAEQRCRQNLDLVGGVSLGLARDLPRIISEGGLDIGTGLLKSAWKRAQERFGMLAKTASAAFSGCFEK
ncbi:MAG: ParB/RepB/Spo0J family partition protein [Candidatus Hydrogenedentes bacterium]|nr:ParB/RepB/Spo0J family partition protein [Candidatus Hydrogenedentota bacterium]